MSDADFEFEDLDDPPVSTPVTAEELAEISRLDVIHCTGISAGWCPTHGDCTCPRDDTDTREEQADDCPLHGEESAHGDDEDEPPLIPRALVLRLARDLTRERATSARLADRCLDLGRELEALRAAVRAHREATIAAHQMPGFARPTPAETAERLWAAAKT